MSSVSLIVCEFVLISLFSAYLLNYYKSPVVPWDATATVYVSWVLGMASVLLLPYDISKASVSGVTSESLGLLWEVIYWR